MFYDRTTTSDGVTVLTETMSGVRSVAIGIWFSVGSRDEDAADAGMSHFLEHMMFKGTPTRTAQDISETFDRLGAELNAFTSKEYTCYYARVLDEHVDVAIEVLAEMVAAALLAQDACESEREVVLEEIARAEDQPDDRVHELFAGALWPGHPIGLPVLGDADAVGGFGHDASAAYRDRHYVTGNTVVAAAGSVAHAKVVGLVERFLKLPAGPRSSRPSAARVEPERLALITKETEQTHICYGVHGLYADHEDRFVLAVLDTVLGGGMSSRLFQEIREKRGLAYAVFSYHSLYEDTGQFAVYAGTRPSNAAEVAGLIRAEFANVIADGVTAEELSRAQESIKGHLVLGLESTRNRMSRLGKTEVTRGEMLTIDELVARIDAITLEDVARVTAAVLDSPRTLAVIGPVSQTEAEALAG
ncbi:MAG: insulinase family protein [Actinobacteria bacterium]|nr:MAG: insulinase family protein [Actinomycetota bacterium]